MSLLEPDKKEQALIRSTICQNCPLRINDTCSPSKEGKVQREFFYKIRNETRKIGEVYTGCGCRLHEKVLSMESQCPLGKWDSYDDRNKTDI